MPRELLIGHHKLTEHFARTYILLVVLYDTFIDVITLYVREWRSAMASNWNYCKDKMSLIMSCAEIHTITCDNVFEYYKNFTTMMTFIVQNFSKSQL